MSRLSPGPLVFPYLDDAARNRMINGMTEFDYNTVETTRAFKEVTRL